MGGGFRLALLYRPRVDHKATKRAFSNNLSYQKTWSTREQITESDAMAFRQWVEDGMVPRGVSGSKARDLSVAGFTSARDGVDLATSGGQPSCCAPQAMALSLEQVPVKAMSVGMATGAAPVPLSSLVGSSGAVIFAVRRPG